MHLFVQTLYMATALALVTGDITSVIETLTVGHNVGCMEIRTTDPVLE